MGVLCVPKASRQMQRTLKNLRVSLFCFLLTFLMLRNTIGAGKFGTPAQDFEEIRQHLHNVGLHRRHFRVLAEAVEEDKQRSAPLLKLEGKQRGEGEEEQRNAPLLAFEETQGNVALLAVDVTHRDAPYLTSNPLEGSSKGVLQGNLGFQKDLEGSSRVTAGFRKDLEGSRFTAWDVQRKIKEGNVGFQKHLKGSRIATWDVQRKIEKGHLGFQKDLEGSRLVMQRKIKEALAQSSNGDSRVLLISELPSSGCKNSAGDNFLLKSLKNKVDYSNLHGLEISLSFRALDPHVDGPLSELSLLQSSMSKYHLVEWLWWVPTEALITDMARTLPLQDYTEFNLVLLSPRDPTLHGTSSINLNTDTFLIRNCQWSLDLLRKSVKMVSAQGRHRDATDRMLTNSLLKRPHIEAGDSSPLIFFSDEEEKFLQDKESTVVLSGDSRETESKLGRMVKQSDRGMGDRRIPFVTHLLGCKLCHEVGDMEGGLCMSQMERAMGFADKQVMQNDGLASSKATIF